MPQQVTPIALHDIDKLARHMSRSQVQPEWLSGWAARVLTGQQAGAHLAIMTGHYLDRLLDGTKTIESRFTRHRIAPFGQVHGGDVIFFKPAAGPISAAGLAGEVEHLDLGVIPIQQVAEKYGKAINPADATFWSDRATARYATLVTMIEVVRTNPLPISKRDRRGWVVLSQTVPASHRLF